MGFVVRPPNLRCQCCQFDECTSIRHGDEDEDGTWSPDPFSKSFTFGANKLAQSQRIQLNAIRGFNMVWRPTFCDTMFCLTYKMLGPGSQCNVSSTWPYKGKILLLRFLLLVSSRLSRIFVRLSFRRCASPQVEDCTSCKEKE